uniref:Uncharacterized protein n=1 Tax=Leersia perrieri TaxID=77586 RepID=A0A0D9X5R5_9ORYZ
MNAPGAINSLLGRLTTILLEEAQLLGRVRVDVEFIKDEMESMNSLLLQLTEAQHRNHSVRTWMKHIVGLTRDCEGNVELYVHYIGGRPGTDGGGPIGYLWRAVRFVRTVRVRHRIATRIRQLKDRARDVGERRQRYGVTVPASDLNDAPAEPEDEVWRRSALMDGDEPLDYDGDILKNGIDTLFRWLSEEPSPATAAANDGEPQVRVFSIVGSRLPYLVARNAYDDPSVANLFGCKAIVNAYDPAVGGYDPRGIPILESILEEMAGVGPAHEDELRSDNTETSSVKDGDEINGQFVSEHTAQLVSEPEGQLVSELQGHLKGKRFLIVIYHLMGPRQWKCTLDALLHAADGCLPGSTILMTTQYDYVAQMASSCKIIDVRNVIEFYTSKAEMLHGRYSISRYPNNDLDMFRDICHPNAFAMKMFLHLLYVNPKRTEEELDMYGNAISECKRLNKSVSQKMLMLCYNELPSKYRSCLLYLTIFPKDHVIRATSLVRRWIAEGLIATTTTRSDEIEETSATDEAKRYLDVLFTRGFVSPVEISAAGNIKSCTLHHEVREFIARVARDVNFVDEKLPPDLAHHLSIHNRIVLNGSQPDSDSKGGIVALLPTLSASSQWQLLKVLDLEGCKGLKKNHLKSICKILLLKYLSLRSTDVTELPRHIKDLQCLETLDIRQTEVRAFAKKAIVLPMLKHFLAGNKVTADKSEESFCTVPTPLGIERMKDMEILSHVLVSNSDGELAGIAQLLKLRKLGVVLHGENAKLADLLNQIKKLCSCLRSLSIRIDQQLAPVVDGENHDQGVVDAALTPVPDFIKSLNISGLTSGLPQLIEQLNQLTKLTLTKTYLRKEDLHILGKLGCLRSLMLQQKSYTESDLAFEKEEFGTLSFLLVGSSNVTTISFADGAAPKLQRVVWSFPSIVPCLSGVGYLHELKEFELNGDCSPDQVRDALEGHINLARFRHNPQIHRQEG